jgi:Pyruvate/2-oxoacid:ferredoxin oxidoreductase delta subunit
MEAAEGCFLYAGKDAVEAQAKAPWPQKVVVSRSLFDADWVINVPKFKTHMQTKVTGAVKNMFGILVGAEKARVHLAASHPEDFARALVGIYQIRVPDLTIMDAIVGMEGNGPSGKDLRQIGKILASRNGVSIDGVMASMMGVAPPKIETLRIAAQAGLGEIDPEKMNIQGAWVPLPKFKMPWTFISQGRMGKILNKLLYRPFIKPRIKVKKDLCTQCGVCIQHCPAQALTMDKIPRLDAPKCISCYCCYELCSSQAIELTGLMKRVTGRK